MDTIKRIENLLADFRGDAFTRIRQANNFREAANIVAEVAVAEKEYDAIRNKAERLAADLEMMLGNRPI